MVLAYLGFPIKSPFQLSEIFIKLNETGFFFLGCIVIFNSTNPILNKLTTPLFEFLASRRR